VACRWCCSPAGPGPRRNSPPRPVPGFASASRTRTPETREQQRQRAVARPRLGNVQTNAVCFNGGERDGRCHGCASSGPGRPPRYPPRPGSVNRISPRLALRLARAAPKIGGARNVGSFWRAEIPPKFPDPVLAAPCSPPFVEVPHAPPHSARHVLLSIVPDYLAAADDLPLVRRGGRGDPEGARSALPGRGEHQPREPREGGPRPGARRSWSSNGWRVFLVKVHNEAGVTAPLRRPAPTPSRSTSRSTGSPDPARSVPPPTCPTAGWISTCSTPAAGADPLGPGAGIPHRAALQPRPRQARGGDRLRRRPGDAGSRLSQRGADPVRVPAGGPRAAVDVLDDDGTPTTGQLTIRDARPRLSGPLAAAGPDFFFHDQIYRHDGEEVVLPPGSTSRVYSRGPEYLNLTKTITVPAAADEHQRVVPPQALDQAGDLGWYSGDHHVHAAGCSHYEAPTEGVTPGHDAAHPGRGPQRRLRPLVGAVLVSPEAVLRRDRSTSSRRRTT
jgi:hypothetical protein